MECISGWSWDPPKYRDPIARELFLLDEIWMKMNFDVGGLWFVLDGESVQQIDSV